MGDHTWLSQPYASHLTAHRAAHDGGRRNISAAYVPAMPLFCRILTTTRRSSACPSAVASDATW